MSSVAQVPARHRHVRLAIASPGFQRLFGVRLGAQFGDGVFQASLAGAVLFNPEQQAHAGDIAAGFAVLLLPYSLIGPFTGVLIDRWWRTRTLVLANVLRAVAVVGVAAEISAGVHGQPFYASALVVLSLSRFLLSALSAALPHVVAPDELVTANALTTTAGALATTAGGAAAIGVRALVGDSAHDYAAIAVAATVPYLLSALIAAGFGRTVLGPDDVERDRRETVAEIARGLVAGARHLRDRRPALYALSAITAHRLCYGLWAVSSVLLYRNYFHADGPLRVGLSGLAQFVVVIAVGGGLAALVTPAVTRRIGFPRWGVLLLASAGVVELGFGLFYRLPTQLVGAALLGFTAQGFKVCVDTLVQRSVDDEFRGRIFTLYDTLFNLALVVASVITAVAIPDNGYAPASVVVLGVAYLATAAAYLRVTAPRTSA
ncbi:MFS transporter [Jatrophihabitans sp.]|uniref:MFS transporter n=1 Tax=Jatrophihabitans sp. TaxID=1932789 RepID=UPI0030C683C9